MLFQDNLNAWHCYWTCNQYLRVWFMCWKYGFTALGHDRFLIIIRTLIYRIALFVSILKNSVKALKSWVCLSLWTVFGKDLDRGADESYSIQNQKKLLEDFAKKNNLINIRHYIEMETSSIRQWGYASTSAICRQEHIKSGNMLSRIPCRLHRRWLRALRSYSFCFPCSCLRRFCSWRMR